jgi:hypothetical protein
MDTAAPATEPTLSPDISDADLLAAAEAVDAGQPIPAPTASPAPEAKSDRPPAEGQDAKPKESADERAAREEAEAAELAAKAEKPGEQPPPAKPDEKPETPYAKAKKDAERLDKTWKAVNEQKAALEQERQSIAAQKAEFDRLRAEHETLKKQLASAPATDEHGLVAGDYDRLAQKYEREGNDEMARIATRKADALRAKAPASPAPAAAPSAAPDITHPEFQAKWRAETAALVQAEPDLAKPDNPVVQAANALLADKQWSGFLLSRPDGIRAAVAVAKLQQQAARAAQLDTELAAQKAEVARLTKLTSPRGSLPANPAPADRRPEDLSDAEVLALAAQADLGG